jgi:hypothetical protein
LLFNYLFCHYINNADDITKDGLDITKLYPVNIFPHSPIFVDGIVTISIDPYHGDLGLGVFKTYYVLGNDDIGHVAFILGAVSPPINTQNTLAVSMDTRTYHEPTYNTDSSYNFFSLLNPTTPLIHGNLTKLN